MTDLEHSTRRELTEIFRQMPAAMCILDPDLNYVAWTPKWQDDQGLRELDLEGMSVFADGHRFQFASFCPEYFRRALAGAPQGGLIERFETTDGAVEWVNWMVAPYRHSDEVVGIVVSVEIVTRLQELEQQLVNQRSRSVQAAKLAALGEMAGAIAHEINNPLTIVYALLDELRETLVDPPHPPDPEGTADSPESVEDLLGDLDAAVSRVVGIVQGLRKFSRDGARDPFVEHDVRELVADTLALCTQKFRRTNIDLQVHSGDEPRIIWCQPVQVTQVLLNLLNNAYDTVKDIEGASVAVQVRAETTGVTVVVSDNGAGVPPGLADKIMQPFFTTKRIGEGTGLGLSISHQIMREHGGHLRVESLASPTTFAAFFGNERQPTADATVPVGNDRSRAHDGNGKEPGHSRPAHAPAEAATPAPNEDDNAR